MQRRFRRLDAEDATMSQVLAWGMGHDAGIALRVAVALAPWWSLRGRLTSHYLLLREAAGHAAVGSDGWCAAQFWLGCTAQDSADLAASLSHFTALRDAVAERGPCRALADGLAGRSEALSQMGRYAEAAGEARRSLAVAREVGCPAGEVLALAALTYATFLADDRDSAVRLARQAGQITAGVPGSVTRYCGLALQLDTRTGTWRGLYGELDCCGLLCAATGRYAEAVTVWAALAALKRQEKIPDTPPYARRREGLQRQARRALGPARVRAAEDRGAAMTMATAAEYALLLTDPGPPRPAAPGPGTLSARERELVILVAQGRTDAQIAAQLYISIRTVRSHLDRIRDKTGCRRRADLTRLALSTGLI